MTFAQGVVVGIAATIASGVLGVLIGGWMRRAKARQCTGVAAVWCPRHGDCRCPETEGGWRDMNDPACPLHSADSSHADIWVQR